MYVKYLEGYCPEFKRNREIELHYLEDGQKFMHWSCPEIGYCETIERLGECHVFAKVESFLHPNSN